MLEMSPQLQSKVFDSLLLHMKAESLRLHASPPAGSKRVAGSAGPAAGWQALALDLRRLGLNQTVADAVVSWASTQAEQSRLASLKIRVLHPMEKEFISPDGYGYLLELYRLGLLVPAQLENLIENCAFLTSLPATREQVQKMALRIFSEALESQGMGLSH